MPPRARPRSNQSVGFMSCSEMVGCPQPRGNGKAQEIRSARRKPLRDTWAVVRLWLPRRFVDCPDSTRRSSGAT